MFMELTRTSIGLLMFLCESFDDGVSGMGVCGMVFVEVRFNRDLLI